MAIRKRTWKTSRGEERQAWVADYAQQGERHIKSFRTKKAAQDWLARAAVEVQDGIHVPDSKAITVAEAAEIWLRNCEAGPNGGHPLERSTVESYRGHVDNHIIPLIGHRKLSQLPKSAIEALRTELLERLSRTTAQGVLRSFRALLVAGNASPGVIATASQVKIRGDTGRHTKHVEILELEDTTKILQTLDELATTPKWRYARVFINVAVYTGCRMSELRGMPWRSVIWDEGIIRVEQRADRWATIGALKSLSAYRDIPIPDSIVHMLRQWYLERGRPGESALVFGNQRGRPEQLANILMRMWKPLIEKAGVPYVNLHALRHAHASMLIHFGANAKTVQVELGHSNVAFTLTTYTHLFKSAMSDRRERANLLSEALSPTTATQTQHNPL